MLEGLDPSVLGELDDVHTSGGLGPEQGHREEGHGLDGGEELEVAGRGGGEEAGPVEDEEPPETRGREALFWGSEGGSKTNLTFILNL